MITQVRIRWPRHLPSVMRKDEAPCYDRGLMLRCLVARYVKYQQKDVLTDRSYKRAVSAIRELATRQG